MTSFVAVLPAIDPAATAECVATMCPRLVDRLLLVENAAMPEWVTAYAKWNAPYLHCNRGVPRSWNAGVDWALHLDADWLVILSTSIRFGDAGGRDLLDALATTDEPWIVGTQHGWKCIALSRALLERVGRFDPVFSPAYREDTDYLYRMHLAGLPSPRENGGALTQFHVDATSEGDALAVLSKLVTIDWDANLCAYVRKWNGDQGEETFTHPYDDDRLDWTFVGDHDPATIGEPRHA